MENSHVTKLRAIFEAQRNNENAVPMKKYMRDQFPFIGLKSKKRRELSREFMKEAPFHSADMPTMVQELWNLSEREYQYVAVDYLVKFKRHLTLAHVDLVESLITTKSWWEYSGPHCFTFGWYIIRHISSVDSGAWKSMA